MGNMFYIANGGFGSSWIDIPPTIEIFDPPDDRYLAGYKITDNVDGDVKIYGPRLKDLNVPFSLYGLPIPITFGVRRLTGNVIWARPLRESVKRKSQSGKGGPTTKTTTYQYYATFAVAFGIPGNTDSTTRDVIRMWAQNALIMDRRGYAASKWSGLNYTFYKGTPDQLADPTIVSFEGEAATPAYRDVMYCVFHDMPIGDFGNFIPSIGIEIGDVTAIQYLIRNIDTPEIADPGYNDGFADFARGEYYAVKRAGEFSTIKSYSLASGTFLGSTFVNTAGVGWSNNNDLANSSPPSLVNVVGISGNFKSIGYCPWLNLISGKPDDLNLGEPFMLIDPTSGVPRYWIGCHIYSGVATDPKWPTMPSITPGPLNGIIPQWDHSAPFRAYTGYEPSYFFMIATVYNDLVLLKLDALLGHLDMVWWSAGVGKIRCMIEGELRVYDSDFYYTKEGGSEVFKMEVSGSAGRLGVGVTTISHGVSLPERLCNVNASIYAMLYYSVDNSLILFKTNNQAEKIDCSSGSQVWNVAISNYNYVGSPYAMHLHNLENGSFSWTQTGSVHELNLVTGEITEWPEAAGKYVADAEYSDSRNSSIAGMGSIGSTGLPGATDKSVLNAQSTLMYNRVTDARMPLADFIRGMALYAGYLPEQIYIDPSIDDTIDGAIITQITSFNAVMQSIQVAYRLEMFESAGVVKFTRRALGSDATSFSVVQSELLLPSAEEPAGETPTLQIRREEENAVPQEVSVRFIDKSLGYQWNMQSARRSQFISTNTSDEQLSVELPIIMTASEAKAMATRILWQAWNSRVSYSFRVGQYMVKMEPGDFGTLTSQGMLFNIKVAQVTYNTDFSINVQATNSISDENLVIVADTGGQEDPGPRGPSMSDIFIFDVPLLSPELDQSPAARWPYYVYVGPVSYEMSWSGGEGYVTLDGTDYTQITTNVDTGLVMAVKSWPVFSENDWMTWDDVGQFVVVPKQGDVDLLVAATKEEVLQSQRNIAFFGANGRWELIAFTTVSENPDGSWVLGGLLRGLRGTDFNMDSHLPGDYLVLADQLYIDAVYAKNIEVDQFHGFRGVGFGIDLLNGMYHGETLRGHGALPIAPSGARVERSISAATGDLTISWTRRDRLMRPMIPGGQNSGLTSNEIGDYRVTVYRWPHRDAWEFTGGRWRGRDSGSEPDFTVYDVTGSEQLVLSASQIRSAQLYEYEAPDDLYNAGSTFSQHEAGYDIQSNTDANVQIRDLGYGEFVAFRSIDVMIQQKTTIGNTTGYGPGRRMTIVIEDT